MSERRRGAARAALLCTLLSGGCAAPPPRPLELEALAGRVVARDATVEQAARALELVDLRALGLEPPSVDPGASADPDDPAPWRAVALAYNVQVTTALRRLEAARARGRAAGAPDPALLQATHVVEGGDRMTGVMLAFDVLGLLDAGRAAAARELAGAEARAAFADLEAAVWATGFEVERARARLAAALALEEDLQELVRSSGGVLARAELLAARDRVGQGTFAAFLAAFNDVEHRLHLATVAAVEARRALAAVTGLPPDAPALAALTRGTIEAQLAGEPLERSPAPRPADERARRLLEQSPRLRRARLEYAVAEARLADEVARTRPGVRLGPALELRPDDLMLGGALMLDLPHARALSGRVDAALALRELARDELEEALRDELARAAEADARLAAAREALLYHVRPQVAATERAWTAAGAAFAADPGRLEGAGGALRDRAGALGALWLTSEQLVAARLDGEEARGPERRSAPAPEPESEEPVEGGRDERAERARRGR